MHEPRGRGRMVRMKAPVPLALRLARPEDAPAMAVMSRDLIETGLPWHYRPQRIASMIGDRDTLAVVACGTERIPLGFAVASFAEDRAHLSLLAVRPGAQRRGVGRRLMQWLLESAQVAGIESVHLELRAANRAAFAFYSALGFSATVVVPDYYARSEAALRMVRVLRRAGTGELPAWQPPKIR